jgi:Lipase maturation factor
MNWLQAPNYVLSRLLVERALGGIYGVAFLVTLNQFRPLCGERGLLPAPRYLSRHTFWDAPSIFHFHYSDRALALTAWIGVILSAAIVLGAADKSPLWLAMSLWFVLWALYLSIIDIGQVFYSFGWESLLVETGFLAIFLGPASMAPPLPVIWMFRWLLFRLEFGAGLIKLRGDACWRDLSCLFYHHETQPMPNPLSWFFHHLPKPIHRFEVLGNHIAQLVLPFGLFLPQPVPDIAAALIVVTQCWLILSGNFSWLNFNTIAIALASFDDAALGRILPIRPPSGGAPPLWYAVLLGLFTVVVAALSIRPAINLFSRHQVMNSSFEPFRLVNSYGAFGSVTRVRNELVIEGTDSVSAEPTAIWKAYELKGQPGDPMRRPPQIAPYHLRLDWLMWFAALSPSFAQPWLGALLGKLLENDRPTLGLFRTNPFPDRPPALVRVLIYRYRFTSAAEHRDTGAWWSRELLDEFLPPMRLPPSRANGTPE